MCYNNTLMRWDYYYYDDDAIDLKFIVLRMLKNSVVSTSADK